MLNGSVPSDLSPALVVDVMEISRLQERIKQLQAEKSQQRDLYCEARKHHVKLIHDRRDVNAEIQGGRPSRPTPRVEPENSYYVFRVTYR